MPQAAGSSQDEMLTSELIFCITTTGQDELAYLDAQRRVGDLMVHFQRIGSS